MRVWSRGWVGGGPNLRSLELQPCIVSTSQPSINCGILSGDVPDSAHISSSEQRDSVFILRSSVSAPELRQTFFNSCIACFAPGVSNSEIKKAGKHRTPSVILLSPTT